MNRVVGRGFLIAVVASGCGAPPMAVPSLSEPPRGGVLPGTGSRSEGPTAPESPGPYGRRCVDPIREIRPAASRPRRALELAEAEHKTLLRLYEITSKPSPDRALLALHLGDVDVELAELEAAKTSQHEADAIEHYGVAAKGPGPVDEATYCLGLVYECQGDTQEARRLFYQVVQRAPGTRLAPYAYFAFGELFLKEAATDPIKLDLAEQAYREARKFPSPLSKVADERLREVRSRRGDAPEP